MVKKFTRFQKNSFQTIFFSALLGILLFVVIGFLIVSSWKITQRKTELQSRVEELRRDIQTVEIRNQELKAQAARGYEEEYLEQEARERFNLRKPGEEVVTILKEEGEVGESQKEQEAPWRGFLEPFKWLGI